MGGEIMSEYNWCHGPTCHGQHTQDRLRGVKGSKVLRTRKVRQNTYIGMFSYFCSNGCYNAFANKHIQEITAIAPRTEALETPIEVTKKPYTNSWSGQTTMETRITTVDNG